MRVVSFIGMWLLLLTGSTALAQEKNGLDGYDEGSIDFIKGMAKDVYKDTRSLAQIFKDNALIRAAGHGDLKAIRNALKAGALVNSIYLDGCAAFGSDASGEAALLWAIDGNHLEAVNVLIEAKADVNLKSVNLWRDGETAVYRAVKQDRAKIVEALVKAGAKEKPEQIRLGIEMRRAACRGFKLKEGQGYPRYPGNASGKDAPKIADVLKRGGDINAPDPAGYTPLMYAANLGLVENVKILLANGADATRQTYASPTSTGGTTALSLAEEESSFAPAERRQVVAILEEHLAKKK
jgi:ankyrin repeat protein